MVDTKKLEAQRARRVAKEEAKAGIREGHWLLNGELVHVWVEFYPKVQWYVEHTEPPRAESIPGTRRVLTEADMKKLESWL